MNVQSLIDAIRSTNGMRAEFKDKLVELIHAEDEACELSDDEQSVAALSDDDDDVFDSIVKSMGIPFSEEQIEFMNLAVNYRRNLMLTAGGGFGKSAVIETTMRLFNKLVSHHSDDWFYKKYGSSIDPEAYKQHPVVGLCASTGKAASLIKGKTFHSYMGIGLGRGSVDEWVSRVSNSKFQRGLFHSLRAVQTIIIDEISMISSKMLDDISEYLKQIRKSKEPFGGIQMIFVGDFAQLSPVQGLFAFESREYNALDLTTYKLTKCFRQTDARFLDILNNLRYGDCSPTDLSVLRSRTSIDPEYSRGLKPMRLLSTNAEVDTVNARELERSCIENKTEVISFGVKNVVDRKKAEACMKADMIPNEVLITVGAQIVVTTNLAIGAMNGTQGKILRIGASEVVIESHEGNIYTIGYFGYKDPDNKDIFSAKVIFQYLPLRLGWASTIHKSQGMTLSLVEVDLRRVFTHGQAYVALSRAKSLEGLIVKNLFKKSIICDPKVKAYYA